MGGWVGLARTFLTYQVYSCSCIYFWASRPLVPGCSLAAPIREREVTKPMDLMKIRFKPVYPCIPLCFLHGLGYTRFNHLGAGGWVGPESNLSQIFYNNKIYTIHQYLGWVGGWVSDPFPKLKKKSFSGRLQRKIDFSIKNDFPIKKYIVVFCECSIFRSRKIKNRSLKSPRMIPRFKIRNLQKIQCLEKKSY